MKSTGIVRRIDELGRVVIPAELRRTMGFAEKDAMEIYTEGDAIVFKRYEACCSFCKGSDDIRSFKDKPVCSQCLNELKSR